MKLLFITQKLHGQDSFTVLWVRAFKALGYDVTVLALEWQPDQIEQVLGERADDLNVVSLGKEKGVSKVGVIFNFWKRITTLQYDRVFIHMTPVWGLCGAPVWIFKRTPVYLWYTHYKMQAGLKLLGLYGKRLFCATPQSLPQYEGSSKKVVVGHGIDLTFWPMRENTAVKNYELIVVHRLARSKRLKLVIQAIKLLPKEYTLHIYGNEPEPTYSTEMKKLVADLHLENRISFKGSCPMKDLPALYTSHRFILNMASETIDKTMLEAMTCGCYPVTTARNAEAIGIPLAPKEDTPEAIATFIQAHEKEDIPDTKDLYTIVKERHSLAGIVAHMNQYIQQGI